MKSMRLKLLFIFFPALLLFLPAAIFPAAAVDQTGGG